MVAREAFDDAGARGLVEQIAEFSRFLIREDRSPATVRSYEWGLRDFAEFIASQGITSLHQVTRRTLETWQDRLIAARMKARSRSLATTALRQFLKWAADHDYCDGRLANWLAKVRLRPLQPKPIPPDDLERLRAYYVRRPHDLHGFRNRALFFYFLSTGARVSEALQVRRQGFERATIRQKGGTDKLLVVPETVAGYVREYLNRRTDGSSALFVNHPTLTPMQPSAVRDVWRHVAAQLGIRPFTTHQLRHTFATELLERGIDPVTVAELLGHHGMQTIRNYAQVRESARSRALDALEKLIAPPPAPLDPRAQPPLALPKRVGRPRFRITRPGVPDSLG